MPLDNMHAWANLTHPGLVCVAGADAHGEWYGWYLRHTRRKIAYPGIYNLKGRNGYTGDYNDGNYLRQGTTARWDTSAARWYQNMIMFVGAHGGTPTCWQSIWGRRAASIVGGSTGGAGFQSGGWESFDCSQLDYFGCANYDGG
jgi:hypothetical protein